VTVHRGALFGDASARFEIETPTARVMAVGTTPRVVVVPGGVTRVAHLPESPGAHWRYKRRRATGPR
jgi:hypothetical protein